MNWTKAIDIRIHAVWPESTAVMLFELWRTVGGPYVPALRVGCDKCNLQRMSTYEFVSTCISPWVTYDYLEVRD